MTKFGRILDGGGHQFVGRHHGLVNRAVTSEREGTRTLDYQSRMGIGYLHTVVDDHSRVAYVEMCEDERADTAIGVLRRAVTWFADRGVFIQRVLSDNGSAYRSYAWRAACVDLEIAPKRTRPYRPQTNGKIERFYRTLAKGWAYARFYGSERERREALPGWIHSCNHHRRHSAIGAAPISRLNNLPGHHITMPAGAAARARHGTAPIGGKGDGNQVTQSAISPTRAYGAYESGKIYNSSSILGTLEAAATRGETICVQSLSQILSHLSD